MFEVSPLTTRGRLLAYFGIIAGCGAIAFVVLWFYGLPILGIQGTYSSDYQRAINLVEAVADKEQITFEHWFGGHRRDLKMLSSSEDFSSTIGTLHANPDRKASPDRARLERELITVKEASPGAYDYIYVIDPANKRLLASSEPHWLQVPQDQLALLHDTDQQLLSESILIAKSRPEAGLLIVNQIARRDESGIPTGAMNGIMVARLKLAAPLQQEELSMRQKLGLSGGLLVVDQDGHVIVRSSKANQTGNLDFIAKTVASGTEGIKLISAANGGSEFISAFRYLHLGASEGLSLIVAGSTYDAQMEMRSTFIRMAIFGSLTFLFILILIRFAANRIGAEEEKNTYLAFYNPLTQLPNRRLMLDRLQQAISSSAHSQRHCALLMIDMDNFKTLNDTLGHNTGDLFLRQAAQRLKESIRENDTVAHLGADEFVVIVEDLSISTDKALIEAESITEKIISALRKPYELSGSTLHMTPSIGIALFADSDQSMDECLKQADIAVYQAKLAGRNTFRFFDAEMQARIMARSYLEKDLRRALEEEQFLLHFQAQVDHNRNITGAEVLIRWKHPERGMISPLEFIPLAEETGLILPIGQWVLETACACLKAWENNPRTRNLILAVNVSASQFSQPEFVEQVCQTINRYAINPGRLKMEVTESMVMNDIDDTIMKMQMLGNFGIRFAMDDFGTGYSSLANLKKLPVNQIKIDQSFVRDISLDPEDAIIVQAIIAMAANLKMEIIAEGVETDHQLNFLQAHGCHLFQGYLFSRPVSLESFDQLIEGQ